MNADIEITLSYDGGQWIAIFEECRISAGELRELEDRIIQTIRQKPCYTNRETVRVWLGFDYNSIPGWLRQYHAHYFNSQLTISMPSKKNPVTPSG